LTEADPTIHSEVDYVDSFCFVRGTLVWAPAGLGEVKPLAAGAALPWLEPGEAWWEGGTWRGLAAGAVIVAGLSGWWLLHEREPRLRRRPRPDLDNDTGDGGGGGAPGDGDEGEPGSAAPERDGVAEAPA
jgi:hypothetical protein